MINLSVWLRFSIRALGLILILAPVISQVYLRHAATPEYQEDVLINTWRSRAEKLMQLLNQTHKNPLPDFTSDFSALKKRLNSLDAALCLYRNGRAVFWTHPDVPPFQPARAGEITYLHYANHHLLALSQGTLFGFLRLAEGAGPDEDTLTEVQNSEAPLLFFKQDGPGRRPFQWHGKSHFWIRMPAHPPDYGFSEIWLGLWWMAAAGLLLLISSPFDSALLLMFSGVLILKLDIFLFGIKPAFSTFCGPSGVALGPVMSSASALWASSLLAFAAVRWLTREQKSENHLSAKTIRWFKPFRGLVLRLAFLPSTAFLLYVLGETVQNSTVPLSPAQLHLWNVYSFLLLASFLLYVLAWKNLSRASVQSWWLLLGQKPLPVALEAVFSMAVSFLFWPVLTVLFALAVVLIYGALLRYLNLTRPSTRNTLIHAVLISLIAGVPLRLAQVQKVKDFMALKAPELSAAVDPDVDYLFQSLYQELNPGGHTLSLKEISLILRRLQASHKQRFAIKAAVFDARIKSPLLYDASGPADYDYFENRIALSGHETSTDGLFRITRPGSSAFYIGRILQTSAVHPRLVMVEIVPRSTAYLFADTYRPGLAFTDRHPTTPAFAYALLEDSLIVESGGLCDYTAFLSAIPLQRCQGPCFFHAGGFRHYLWPSDARHYTIVSVPEDNTYAVLSYFTIIFLLVLSSEGLSSVMKTLKSEGRRALLYNFRFRIRLAIVGLLTLFFALSLGGTLVFLSRRIEDKNKSQLKEKVAAVLIDLEDNLEGKIQDPSQEKQFLDFELTRLSELIFSDINFFNAGGKLISTSNPALLEDGIVFPLLPPLVFKALSRGSSGIVVTLDQAGEVSYYAGYGAVVDNKNRLLGYAQVPFVSRQPQYEQELAATLNTLFNAYAAALSLLLTLSIVLINSATVPLTKISQKLRSLRYGKASEPLDYPGKDEIGRLVEEYNRLAAELEKSAAELARRERESAWKDVARQVAHEIKNPLTPMKLGVQYLERAWQEDRETFPQKLARFRDIMVNQIEALDRIASDFSAYAQIGPPRPEAVEILPLMKSVCDLFSDSERQIQVEYKTLQGDLKAFADREQLLRVLNNLVKNAVQSIPVDRKGYVRVTARREDNSIIIEVHDNGVGIPADRQSRIFTPYFTTKSGGTGIGLSLCKNLVENNGGHIWFSSTPEQGTIFYVKLPAAP